MKKSYLSILFLLIAGSYLCCTKQQTPAKLNLETIISHKNYGKVKSYQRKLDRHEIKDSVVVLNYKVDLLKDTIYNYYYELPIKGKQLHQYSKGERYSDVAIRLMDSVRVRLNDQKRTIYKYQYDELHSYDEEMLLYYVEDIGIIRQESYIWMNHNVLVEHPNVDKALLYGYHEKIRHQLKPFRSRKTPPPPKPK